MSIAVPLGGAADCASEVAASTMAAAMPVCLNMGSSLRKKRRVYARDRGGSMHRTGAQPPSVSPLSGQAFFHWLPLDQSMVLPSAEITPSMFQGGPALIEIGLVNVAVPTSPLSFLISR